MTRRCRRWSVAGALLGSLLAGIPAHGQPTTGLVLEVSGTVTPGVRPWAELPADARLTLDPGARLVFNHYATCRVVSVIGGTVTVGVAGYTLEGGRAESETRRPCLRKIRLQGSGTAGGIVLRSLKADLVLPVRPRLILVGARAGGFETVRVMRAGQTLLDARLDGPRFAWPETAPALEVGQDYELVLVPRDAGMPPVTTRFRTATNLPDDTPDLIHVE